MASSATEATRGTERIPTPIPAAARLKVFASPKRGLISDGVITVSAKNPSTTLGMPASTSRMGLTILRTRGEAYSER